MVPPDAAAADLHEVGLQGAGQDELLVVIVGGVPPGLQAPPHAGNMAEELAAALRGKQLSRGQALSKLLLQAGEGTPRRGSLLRARFRFRACLRLRACLQLRLQTGAAGLSRAESRRSGELLPQPRKLPLGEVVPPAPLQHSALLLPFQEQAQPVPQQAHRQIAADLSEVLPRQAGLLAGQLPPQGLPDIRQLLLVPVPDLPGPGQLSGDARHAEGGTAEAPVQLASQDPHPPGP